MLKKILVSGADGFFGRAVVKTLNEIPEFQIKPYLRAELDITDKSVVRDVIERYRPDVVINCAGITGNANCAKDPEFTRLVNVVGVANLASVCKEMGILLIHPSSVVIFSGIEGNYKESDQSQPQEGNLYAQTKYESEQAVKESGVHFIIPRFSTLYGPVDPKDTTNFVGQVVGSLKKGEARKYFSDQTANPVEISDVAGAIALLIKNNFSGIVHIGGPQVLSMFDFAQIIKEEYGLSGMMESSSVAGTSYSPNITLDISLSQKLGILYKGVKEGVRYCKNSNS